MRTITPAQFAELWKSNRSLELIDVRTPAEFRETHIEFARNVPLDQLNPSEFGNGGGASEPVYVICQSGTRSQMACERLHKAGVANVVSVEGGTPACEGTDLPLVRGKKTISLERQVRIAAGSIVLIGV